MHVSIKNNILFLELGSIFNNKINLVFIVNSYWLTFTNNHYQRLHNMGSSYAKVNLPNVKASENYTAIITGGHIGKYWQYGCYCIVGSRVVYSFYLGMW